MLLGRSDRGLLAQWWFTVDRGLMSAVLLLMASGVLISMAASPPVAARIGIDTFHFFKSATALHGARCLRAGDALLLHAAPCTPCRSSSSSSRRWC
jgi:hypothetical protein